MDPVSAIGLAASSLQLASLVFTVALKSILIIKDFKDVPARLRICLSDAENSIRRLSDLQAMLSDANSKLYKILNQEQILRLEAVVRDGQDATEELHKNLQALVPPQAATGSRNRVRAAWKSVVSLGMEKDVEDAIRRIQRLNDGISREVQLLNLESQVDLREHIDTVSRREHEVTRAELQSLRDAVLPVITGQTRTLSITDQTVAVRLSDTDKADLTKHLCQALMDHPSALKESYENAISLSEKQPERHRRNLSLSRISSNSGICGCSKRRRSSVRRPLPGIGLEYESQADHLAGCPLASYSTESWSYTVSFALLPLVTKTVAFTFGAKRQGGGFSISPALRVYATVRRADSPLFRAFDEATEDPYVWGSEARAKFVKIKQLLMEMMASGTGSLTDKDENGHTFLHEIAYTVHAKGLGYGDYKLIPELRDLLELAVLAGLDAGAKASGHHLLDRKFYPDENTVSDVIMFSVMSERSWDLLSFDYFGKFGMEYTTRVYNLTVNNRYLGHRFYAKYEEVSEALGPLGPIVLHRSLDQLKSMLQSPTFRAPRLSAGQPLMFLATPWHDGLRLLLNAGFNPQSCMEEALREDDLEGLKIALEFQDLRSRPSSCLSWAVMSSDPVQQYLVDIIRQRRNGLLQLCYQHLTGPELAKLDLPGQTLMDANVELALDMLMTKRLPRDVDNGDVFVGERPVYTMFSWILGAQHERVSALLEKLYTAGFRDIDGQRIFARKSWKAAGLGWHGDESRWTMLKWLAEKAVLPLRSLIKHWPSALFDFVLAYSWNFIRERQLSRQVKDILKALTVHCDATQRDGCECFCSQGGCLPSRLFLAHGLNEQIPNPLWSRDTNGYRFLFGLRHRMLRSWCQGCSLDEVSTAMYTEDAVRLQVFNRLGMIHTCCKVTNGNEFQDWHDDPAWWKINVCCTSDHERQQVQDEDAELNEQLERIMDAYHNYAQRHGATSIDALDGWWVILDGILVPTIGFYYEDEEDEEVWPPRIPHHVADAQLHDDRAAQERELLIRNGYGDLDFMEVIRRHFREYLSDEDETTTAESETEEHHPPADTQQPSSGSLIFQDQGRQSHVRRRNSF